MIAATMKLLRLPALIGIGAALLAGGTVLAAPSAEPGKSDAPKPDAPKPDAPKSDEAKPAAATTEPKPQAVAPTPGPFIAPDERGVAFRRDRLPLDVDAMELLSRHCGVLAQAQGCATPPQRRTVAQLLALALALQPENQEARGILEKAAKGELKPGGDEKQLASARAWTWQVLAWLEKPAAGRDGNALAACLDDVLVVVDPDHPRAEELRKKGEQGAWAGWVQPLESFARIQQITRNNGSGTSKNNGPGGDATGNSPIRLAAATVTTPLWTIDKASGATVLRPVTVRMQAKPKEGWTGNDPLSCDMNSPRANAFFEGGGGFRQVIAPVLKALEKQRGNLPAGVTVDLTCGDNADYLMDRNHSAVTGAAAVLINTAVSGSEPSATIIGEIQADGSFKLPPRFWDKLRSLTSGGGRLVLPREAESYLPSILALEDPGFFFKYEVLLASNLEELIARSAKTPAPELLDITAKFQEVRSKLGSQPVTGYVANPYVRQRLIEIAKASSFHSSARMLAIQGSGQRPSLLPRNVLANELRRAILPMAWIQSHAVETLQTNTLKDTYENCLRDVDHLERYAEMRDRPLHTQVRELVLTVRSLYRATRGRSYDAKNFFIPWRAEFDTFSKTYQTVLKTLTVAAADG